MRCLALAVLSAILKRIILCYGIIILRINPIAVRARTGLVVTVVWPSVGFVTGWVVVGAGEVGVTEAGRGVRCVGVNVNNKRNADELQTHFRTNSKCGKVNYLLI